jgi:hypothetical protein
MMVVLYGDIYNDISLHHGADATTAWTVLSVLGSSFAQSLVFSYCNSNGGMVIPSHK